MVTATLYHCTRLNEDVCVSIDRLYVNGWPVGTLYFECDGAERCGLGANRFSAEAGPAFLECVHPDRPGSEY